MVGTEENSLSDLLGAALPKGVLAGLPGFSKISSPDVPAAAFAAKPIEAFSYGTATPAIGELAEPAAEPFRYDTLDETQTTKPAGAGLTLVADNGTVGEESSDRLESEELRAAKEAAVMQIEDMIEQARLNGDDEGKMRLEAILLSVKGAKTISAIASAQSLTGQASSGKAETPEARAQRILDSVREGADNIKDDIYGVMNDEDKARDDAFDEQIAEARKKGDFALALKLEREQNDWRAQRVEEWRVNGTPEQKEVVPKVVPAIKDQDKVIKEAADEMEMQSNLYRGVSSTNSPQASLKQASNPAQIQAQSSASILTAIAYNSGAQELTRPLETPAEAAAAAARGTTRNI